VHRAQRENYETRRYKHEKHLDPESQMDITTLLIVVLLVVLLGGGGWYGRGRWFGRDLQALKDVVIACRADEAGHRDVSHRFADEFLRV
jgi:hypothetical protein